MKTESELVSQYFGRLKDINRRHHEVVKRRAMAIGPAEGIKLTVASMTAGFEEVMFCGDTYEAAREVVGRGP